MERLPVEELPRLMTTAGAEDGLTDIASADDHRGAEDGLAAAASADDR